MANLDDLTRVRPYDLRELIAKFGASDELETMILNMREGSNYKCPKCGDDPVDAESGSGRYNVDGVLIHCEVCDGLGKTEVQYQAVSETIRYEPIAT